jgi:hypothetical protein
MNGSIELTNLIQLNSVDTRLTSSVRAQPPQRQSVCFPAPQKWQDLFFLLLRGVDKSAAMRLD